MNLTYLRLSYNAFVGEIPTDLGALHHLELVQLNGNRIEGTVPIIDVVSPKEHWSFVSDCGVPSAFDVPVTCKGVCTILCLLWAGGLSRSFCAEFDLHSAEIGRAYCTTWLGFQHSLADEMIATACFG